MKRLIVTCVGVLVLLALGALVVVRTVDADDPKSLCAVGLMALTDIPVNADGTQATRSQRDAVADERAHLVRAQAAMQAKRDTESFESDPATYKALIELLDKAQPSANPRDERARRSETVAEWTFSKDGELQGLILLQDHSGYWTVEERHVLVPGDRCGAPSTPSKDD